MYISTTDNQLASFTDTIINVFQEFDVWSTYEVNLSELGYDNQSIYIAIVNITSDGFKLYIDDITVDVDDPRGIDAGISQNDQPYFMIYPNPATSFIQIETEQFETISILDLSGKVIMTEKSDRIDISSLTSGTYLVGITIEGVTYYEKIQKN